MVTHWNCEKCGTTLEGKTAREHECFMCRQCKREPVPYKKARCSACKAGFVPFKIAKKKERRFALTRAVERDPHSPFKEGPE